MNRIRRVFSDFGQRCQRMPRKYRWIGGILAVLIVPAYTAAYLIDEPLRAYVEREIAKWKRVVEQRRIELQ